MEKRVTEQAAELTNASTALQIEITRRKEVDKELLRVNRALRTLSECNQALVRATDESELLNEVCRIIVEVGGYRLAWVGFAEHGEKKTVRPVAQAGHEDGYLDRVTLAWADTELGRGPTGTAIRSGKPSIGRNIATDPGFAIWRAEATKRGYASSIALPLISDGKPFWGALNIYAREPDAFGAAQVQLLAELADDLSYGISTLRTHAERKRVEQALRESKKRFRALIENNSDAIRRLNAPKL